jgi:hypothetical protein
MLSIQFIVMECGTIIQSFNLPALLKANARQAGPSTL